MSRWQTIRTELDTDPLGRGYAGMADDEAAADMNTLYRDGAASGNVLVQTTLTEAHRTNTGLDTEWLTIWSRTQMMAAANPGDDVFGSTPAHLATRTDISAALTILRLLDTDVTTLITNINDARYASLLDALAAADVMSQAQADQMKSLSADKRSRGQELGLGEVTTGDIAEARAL